MRLNGDVFANGKKVILKQLLNEGDKVEVKGKKSFVQVKLSDGSLILQKEGLLNYKILKPKKSLIHFLKGNLFIFKNPESKNKLNVLTKKVSLAVRGTKFFVSEQEDDSYLCVCEGVVAARNKFGILDVTAGEDLHARTRQSLEKTQANEQMMNMAKEGFDFMGVPVKN